MMDRRVRATRVVATRLIEIRRAMSAMGSSDGLRSTVILQRLLDAPENGEAFASFTAKIGRASCWVSL